MDKSKARNVAYNNNNKNNDDDKEDNTLNIVASFKCSFWFHNPPSFDSGGQPLATTCLYFTY